MALERAADLSGRLKFFVIRPEERRVLPEIWKAVEPKLPEIIDGFYAHAADVPHLDGMIAGKCPHLKRAQTGHWLQLFSGRFDDAYFNAVREIGKVHFRIGLEPRWYVGGYQFILTRLFDIAVDSARWSPRKIKDVLRAISTAVMLDMEIAISVYQDELLGQREQRCRDLDGLLTALETKTREALSGLASAAHQLQATAGGMTETAMQTRARSSTVASASEQASVNIQSVASAAEQLSRSIAEILAQVNHSSEAAGRAVAESQAVHDLVRTLRDNAEKISAIVQLIQTIAGQTNLLALNATIEAARAGEAGKGFAVVANEVKTLANQTARATDEITAAIGEIQNASRRATEAIEAIAARIGDLSGNAEIIAQSVEQQGEATQEIARSVQEAAAGAREIACSVAGVNKAAEDTDVSAHQVIDAAASLSRETTRLNEDLGRFVAQAKAV
ncbi:Methyl-accepting chemotaxis protein [Rhodoblastus acidophilus]|uniref:Methyl-accepting chemotaxis protein n=1 Tax=Rhodoblastus acidophilus TaxID=1074 RepID=A0A212R8T5_RHOAC|nr:globin-coupled sensor protein [Rhodoblastus acidophilus]SNB68636.1 Methyl-accepting chemotaxis protein [Rhodoblastus acidophilus]